MARRQFGGPIRVGRGSRRETRWLDLKPVSATMVSEGGTILFSLTTIELALRPFTIVRTHVAYHVHSDQAAAFESQVGAVGFAVVSDQAVAVGITAVPTPITDLESDLWFVHEIYMQSSASVVEGQVGFRYTIDSKAMRKVEDGQDVVVLAELDNQGSGQDIILGGRMLIKLH